jgi:membrane protease YdiL (CAAX protease family)
MYWIGWCVLFPLWVLGPPGVRAAFAAPRMPMGRLHWKDYALIALPPLVGDIFAFPSAIREASPPVVAASAIIALVNAVGEELLWRGVFLRAFPRRLLLGQIYASLTFGLWHVAPQTVAPSRHPGGSASFAVFATAVGLIYGRIAARTGSIRASTLSHALLDFSGLGARVYFR